MMKLLAGAFAGFAAMFGGLFGGHGAASSTAMHGPMGMMGSTSPIHMASSTDMHGGMGMMGGMGVFGMVTAVNGSSLTVEGHGAGQGMATTTYTVDASSASVMKNNATSTVSDVSVGDTVMVSGTVSGTSVTAKMIMDGLMNGMMHGGMHMGGGMGPGMMGSSTSAGNWHGKPPVAAQQ